MVGIFKTNSKNRVKGDLVENKVRFGEKIIAPENEAVPQYDSSGNMVIDSAEAQAARKKYGMESTSTRGDSNDLQDLLQKSDYEEVE
eukprot:CAMPEP_0176380510 /NCGR_PEP_ID=MMETSP0126-20121128/31183_1 /TAXON_ID=141414 ORGANISM="Strombidinopsis acuminatum, Strain SPMC142" /NCGR_SAMPLE_ID=MMETSP0126 /ASSEMBLY_ACC=CAM_ASM_000229 /LENGTH=86 /DNA_ID=CAMNT_0017743865 /DNA_START=2611 /DNA_END=2871 /DNA_ORIENTATION=-